MVVLSFCPQQYVEPENQQTKLTKFNFRLHIAYFNFCIILHFHLW